MRGAQRRRVLSSSRALPARWVGDGLMAGRGVATLSAGSGAAAGCWLRSSKSSSGARLPEAGGAAGSLGAGAGAG